MRLPALRRLRFAAAVAQATMARLLHPELPGVQDSEPVSRSLPEHTGV